MAYHQDDVSRWQTKFLIFALLTLIFSLIQLVLAVRTLDQSDKQEIRIDSLEKHSSECGCGKEVS